MSKGVCVITGSSRGIGRACALLAAEYGYSVIVNYASDTEAAADVVTRINADGGQVVAVRGDVSVEVDIEHIFAAADRMGPLTGLINNAGVVSKSGRVEDYTAERLERIVGINIIGTILCAREAVKRMSTKRGGQGGAIVNISSVASTLGSPNEYVDYAATKGAVDSFTIGLAKEVAMEGIRVNAVRPGMVTTDIHEASGDPGRVERIRPTIPMQRIGDPEEIARAALWLLSDEASYCTGSFITASGGRF
jgi:NAD(P)-dependent dehydrogenase (short-subunit alcohol dehydrogenase family)